MRSKDPKFSLHESKKSCSSCQKQAKVNNTALPLDSPAPGILKPNSSYEQSRSLARTTGMLQMSGPSADKTLILQVIN
jgi:hypothetical protein